MILENLIGVQQFRGYLPFVQYLIEKLQIHLRERHEPGQKIAAVLDKALAEVLLYANDKRFQKSSLARPSFALPSRLL